MENSFEEDKIHLLPSHVANQIAAGEVVQRPSSIIKELVENSVDAGAKSISIHIEDGGMTLIQVIDDGMGMSRSDAVRAFERHATSKIRKAEDLFSLYTFGFRGEALASIAAVSQVEMRTRRSKDDLGISVTIGPNSESQCQEISTPIGTNIIVRNLFYNIPARRKFLKTSSYETRLVIQEFERIALVNPDISFNIRTSGSKPPIVLNSGNLHQRIVALKTKSLGAKLLPIEVSTTTVSFSGYISTQSSTRKGSNSQFFFVNGRYINCPYLQRAIVDGYGKLLNDSTLPNYFIYIEVDPNNLDVNIHPTKTQVKFSDEQIIWQVLNSAVRQTLGKHNIVPSLDFNTSTIDLDIPVYKDPKTFHQGHTDNKGIAKNFSMPLPSSTSGRSNYDPFSAVDRDQVISSWESSSFTLPDIGIDSMPSSSSFSSAGHNFKGTDPELAPFTEQLPDSLLAIVASDESESKSEFTSELVDNSIQSYNIISHESSMNESTYSYDLAHESAINDSTLLYESNEFNTVNSSWQNVELNDYIIESSSFDTVSSPLEDTSNNISHTGSSTIIYESKELPLDIELNYDIIIHNDRYLVWSTFEGIMLIDYYRALGRIAYESHVGSNVSGSIHGQRLLDPIILELSPLDHQLLLSNQEELNSVGIDIGDMGHNSLAIYTLPSNLDITIYSDPHIYIDGLITELHEPTIGIQASFHQQLSLAMCRSYYKGNFSKGRHINKQSAVMVLNSLMSCEEPSFTPDGLPIIEVISSADLLSKFKR